MPAPYIVRDNRVFETVDGLEREFATALTDGAAQTIAAALNSAAGGVEYGAVFVEGRMRTLPLGNMFQCGGSLNTSDDVEGSPMEQIVPDDPHGFVPVDPHRWTRQGDEYACRCGARWDVAEGDQHP